MAVGANETSGSGRILVGFDGSDGGRDALELARTLAAVEGREIVVVTVLPSGPLPTGYALLDEEAADAERLLANARAALAPAAAQTRVYGGGSPAAVITGLAEREGAGSVVVGSPHRGAVGRVLIGSVAEGLLHGAPCEVAAAPRGYAADRHAGFGTVAVAFDGTPESRAALRRAEALARAANARLWILTVAAPPLPVVPGTIGYAPPQPPDPERLLREAAAAVDRDLGVETRCLAGEPATAIAAACEGKVDLLLAGSRGYGPLARVLLGSVSRRLARKAPCPVLVVPRP